MSDPVSIPQATSTKLATPASPGSRHQQIVEIVVSLVSAGLNGDAVFAQLRPNYGQDVSDIEIRSVIGWAENRLSKGRKRGRFHRPDTGSYRSNDCFPRFTDATASNRQTDPEAAVTEFLNGFNCGDVDLWERSPVRLPESFEIDASILISTLFEPEDFVNIVSSISRTDRKGSPTGSGTTHKREQWIAEIDRNGPPIVESGAWIRLNPTDANGISDANVTAFRFLLIEFDQIPLSVQLPFLARLRLPISAIISSGGKSLHAWIRIQGDNIKDYREKAKCIFNALRPYGLDTANRNPSRLSRLPGVIRTIGGTEDNRQRLLYLNASPTFNRIIE